jgi:2-polyprenyl-6-hydroxyphenyl methylase/3-demethylubiquinone-9 3-methyltransferase
MIVSVAEQHSAEVVRGERFRFGANWAKFINSLTNEKIAMAERSLQTALASERLDGKSFLDVGSGSGLFSLAARRLGAKVHSFDYDSTSVACTSELKSRYCYGDVNWIIEQGSVLDDIYLRTLGTFDVVYSWGVLHHTGEMWNALDKVKRLARQGGQLYIAIYNDLGPVTDHWRKIKRAYNRLPSLFRLPFAVFIICIAESRSIAYCARHLKFEEYVRRWKQYDSLRGMSKWYDDIDWIGGYPYECATMERLIDFFSKDGFCVEWSLSRAMGTGCNEVVFRRRADFGVFIDNPIPKSRTLLRRCGCLVTGPFLATESGYVAKLPTALSPVGIDSIVLFRDGQLVGISPAGADRKTLIVAPPSWSQQRVDGTKFEVARGALDGLVKPFRHYDGHMFGSSRIDLKHLADDATASHDSSPVYIFEDKRQLEMPHALHADLVKYGRGRFSHWGQELLFSSSDNSDPNVNGRTYEIVIVEQ